MILFLIGPLGAGCALRPAPQTQPATRPDTPLRHPGRMSAPVVNPQTLLTSGPLPLVYLFGAGGDIRIVDADTRATMVSTTAPPNTLIAVDAAGGVVVAGRKIMRGPLDPSHTYEIWFDAGQH